MLTSTVDLVDRMRNPRIGDVSLVGGIEQNQRVVLARIVDPATQLLASRDRTGRVIRKTKVNKIDMFFWRFGNEIVFCDTRQVNDPLEAAVFVRLRCDRP